MKTIMDLDIGVAAATSWVEVQTPDAGLNSSKRYLLSDILALAGAGDLAAVLVAGNDAAGIGITELAGIDNIVNDFVMTAPVISLVSSDSNMYGFIDVNTQIVEFGNQTNYLRITDFDIEVGAPILGYSTTSEMQAYVTVQSDASIRVKFVKGRTTAALPSCTANAGFTTLTSVANQAFSGLTTETDGLTYGILQDILVMDEADPKRFGIYSLTTPGSVGTKWVLTRRADANPGTDLTNMIVLIEQGTRFKNTSWRQTTLNPVFGTDNLNFVPFADNVVADGTNYYRITATGGTLATTAI